MRKNFRRWKYWANSGIKYFGRPGKVEKWHVAATMFFYYGTRVMSDFEDYLSKRADSYFKRTREIVRGHGDRNVTYAVFMRRPVVFCPRLSVEWLEQAAHERSTRFEIRHCCT